MLADSLLQDLQQFEQVSGTQLQSIRCLVNELAAESYALLQSRQAVKADLLKQKEENDALNSRFELLIEQFSEYV